MVGPIDILPRSIGEVVVLGDVSDFSFSLIFDVSLRAW